MRRPLASFVALALSLALCASPALALDRLPKPANGPSAVVRVADLDAPLPRNGHRRYFTDSYWHWRYRAAYTRWIHNEYVRAGYPVRHRQLRTYARAYDCCRHGYRW